MRMSACSSDVCSSDLWLAVSFLGMLAIVSAHGEQGQGGGDYLTGIALALGAALLYAIAALIIKRLTGTPPHLIALIQVSTGVLLLAPWAHFSALPQHSEAWADRQSTRLNSSH